LCIYMRQPPSWEKWEKWEIIQSGRDKQRFPAQNVFPLVLNNGKMG